MTENTPGFVQKIIDSINHPFYVIDVKTYRIVFANKACGFGELDENATCHVKTHKSSMPCAEEHICPLTEVKKTRRAVKTEHIHYSRDGEPKNMEVHGDPVFDENGNLVMMIEYAFDVTERRKAEEGLTAKLYALEKHNKIMLGREKRVLELKKEIDGLLVELGRQPKYGA
ncbi:MAG TPA: hypothetical protein DCL35_07495 [Candidatus Omnitrophica bacterium]|nr:hypothetical protein [Candidatus Omnitrophota bacterium]